MKLEVELDRSRLVGALALQTRDAVTGMPTNAGCVVSAYRSSDGKQVAVADTHPAGVRGFLVLRPDNYRIVLAPSDSALLPSAHAVTVAAPAPPPAPSPIPAIVTALLRPSSQYAAPGHSIVLRGTVQWNQPTHPAARWALVYGTLTPTGGAAATSWTRTDGRGEFALVLPAPTPDSDGNLVTASASIELHAAAPTASTPTAPDDLSDLPLDDGSDAALRAAQPLARTLTRAGLVAGNEFTLNTDTYVAATAGSARLRSNSVILLT